MELRKDSVPFQCKVDNILVLHEDLGFRNVSVLHFWCYRCSPLFLARGTAATLTMGGLIHRCSVSLLNKALSLSLLTTLTLPHQQPTLVAEAGRARAAAAMVCAPDQSAGCAYACKPVCALTYAQ